MVQVIQDCPCEAGCPSCVGAPDEQSPFNAKDLAARFLDGWIAGAGAGPDGRPHA